MGSGARPSRVRVWARQLAMAVLTLLIISLVAFLAMNRSAEQIARNVLGKGATHAQLEAYINSQGLDRPVLVRYVDWLQHYVQGDWGNTQLSDIPVKSLVVPG